MLDLVYAIKHVPTKRLMPQRRGAGHSYWEPTEDIGEPRNPRLFFTMRSAQNALTAWLQGIWRSDLNVTTDWEGNSESSNDLTINEPDVPRTRADMAIVAFKVTEHA